MNKDEVIEKRFLSKLKNLFFSLYEIELEISRSNSIKKITITSDEYDYRISLTDRQSDIKTKINTLIKEYGSNKTE